jgi:hypothetical protein
MLVRQFSESGIQEFRAFLAQARIAPATPVPRQLLEDNQHTLVLTPHMVVEPKDFPTRRTAAEYLSSVLSPLPENEIAQNAGLWTWLGLFFFDQVCAVKSGQRVVTNDYSYVFEPKNSRHYYRHLLFVAWRVLRVAPLHNRLFLGGSVASLDQVTAEVLKRLFLTRIPCLFEVLDRLYWDQGRGKARPGIVSPTTIKPGDLRHRFPIRIRQLEKTYDLHSLTADQLLELLGNEFRFEAPGAVRPRKQREPGPTSTAS